MNRQTKVSTVRGMFTKKVNNIYTIKINLSSSISDGPQDKQNIDLYINSNQENNLSAKNVSDQTDENWNYWVFLPGKNHKKIKGSVFINMITQFMSE